MRFKYRVISVEIILVLQLILFTRGGYEKLLKITLAK